MSKNGDLSSTHSAGVQRLFVMRHGERLDTMNPSWKRTAIRVYDTPITKKGEMVAFRVAKDRFLEMDIHIIYSSPFLRCLQTAQQVSSALEADGLYVSKFLSEIISASCGMRAAPEVPCVEIDSYGINIKQHDPRPFPQYPEDKKDAVARYEKEFQRLADLHWPHNLLLVTHEYGVIQAMAVGGCEDDVEAEYCGSVQLSRSDITQSQWTLEQYCGVYKYDNLC